MNIPNFPHILSQTMNSSQNLILYFILPHPQLTIRTKFNFTDYKDLFYCYFLYNYRSFKLHPMEQKIRKRSFTSYQNSPQLQQSLLNRVLEESYKEGNSNNLSESRKSQSNYKFLKLGFVKSKKAKIFNKFERFPESTARESTENGNLSTIASLKKHISALQSDEMMSYRLNIKKIEPQQVVQPQENHYDDSEISSIIKRFTQAKKQAMTDKFRRKFLLFNSSKIKTEMKTQRSSIKSEHISTKSNQIEINRRKVQLNSSMTSIKQSKFPQQPKSEYQRSKSSISMTARRFYDKKRKDVKAMTDSRYNIYDRERSIKKIVIGKKDGKVGSKSVMTL